MNLTTQPSAVPTAMIPTSSPLPATAAVQNSTSSPAQTLAVQTSPVIEVVTSSAVGPQETPTTGGIVEPPLPTSQTGPVVEVTTSTVLSPPPPTLDAQVKGAIPVFVWPIIVIVIVAGIVVALTLAVVIYWRM